MFPQMSEPDRGADLKLLTKYFGEIECDSKDILKFSNGLFGFEKEREFILLPFEGSGETLLSLQSVQTASLSFVLMNPFALKPDYAPELTKDELAALGVERSQELSFYVMCVVREPVGESTVNLKCPVAVNEDTHQAMQVILETTEYEMRHRLMDLQNREGKPEC